MSAHNICFRREIRKISAFSDEKSALSVAMWLFFFSGEQKPVASQTCCLRILSIECYS